MGAFPNNVHIDFRLLEPGCQNWANAAEANMKQRVSALQEPQLDSKFVFVLRVPPHERFVKLASAFEPSRPWFACVRYPKLHAMVREVDGVTPDTNGWELLAHLNRVFFLDHHASLYLIRSKPQGIGTASMKIQCEHRDLQNDQAHRLECCPKPLTTRQTVMRPYRGRQRGG